MADGLPINFDVPSESAIASYDYNDFAERTGIRLFYGAKTTSSYLLSQNQIFAESIETSGLNTLFTTVWQKTLDLDFDLSAFNSPQALRGTAYVNGCFNYLASNVSDGDPEYYIKFLIRKWDGATETEIANASTATKTQTSDGNGDYLFCVPITIPLTTFKIGEILRITAEGWTRTTVNEGVPAGDIIKITLGHDPMNRDGTVITPSTDTPTTITQLKFWIPFKLDL